MATGQASESCSIEHCLSSPPTMGLQATRLRAGIALIKLTEARSRKQHWWRPSAVCAPRYCSPRPTILLDRCSLPAPRPVKVRPPLLRTWRSPLRNSASVSSSLTRTCASLLCKDSSASARALALSVTSQASRIGAPPSALPHRQGSTFCFVAPCLLIPLSFSPRKAWERFLARQSPNTALRSEEHTSELQSQSNLVCRLLLEKKKND